MKKDDFITLAVATATAVLRGFKAEDKNNNLLYPLEDIEDGVEEVLSTAMYLKVTNKKFSDIKGGLSTAPLSNYLESLDTLDIRGGGVLTQTDYGNEAIGKLLYKEISKYDVIIKNAISVAKELFISIKDIKRPDMVMTSFFLEHSTHITNKYGGGNANATKVYITKPAVNKILENTDIMFTEDDVELVLASLTGKVFDAKHYTSNLERELQLLDAMYTANKMNRDIAQMIYGRLVHMSDECIKLVKLDKLLSAKGRLFLDTTNGAACFSTAGLVLMRTNKAPIEAILGAKYTGEHTVDNVIVNAPKLISLYSAKKASFDMVVDANILDAKRELFADVISRVTNVNKMHINKMMLPDDREGILKCTLKYVAHVNSNSNLPLYLSILKDFFVSGNKDKQATNFIVFNVYMCELITREMGVTHAE